MFDLIEGFFFFQCRFGHYPFFNFYDGQFEIKRLLNFLLFHLFIEGFSGSCLDISSWHLKL